MTIFPHDFRRYATTRAGSGGRPGSGFANVPTQITPDTPDTGRKPDMPRGHVVLVMGQYPDNILARPITGHVFSEVLRDQKMRSGIGAPVVSRAMRPLLWY